MEFVVVDTRLEANMEMLGWVYHGCLPPSECEILSISKKFKPVDFHFLSWTTSRRVTASSTWRPVQPFQRIPDTRTMAGKSKSATSTPRAPASKASADMLNTTARSMSLEAAGTATPTATPRSIATKRKAGDDARTPSGVGSSRSSSAKKPKVSIHTITTVTPSSSGKKSSRPETHRHSSAHVELPLASTTTTTMTPPAKPSGSGKRIVFDDEDENENENEDNDTTTGEFHTPREAPPHNPIEAQLLSVSADGGKGGDHDDGSGSGSDSDSDDEAPEAVSTSTAAAQAAQATQAAARAAEKQEEALRRKRQERDSRFRAQAESRKKQQKREEEEAAAAAEKKKKQKGESDDSEADSDDDDDKVPASTAAKTLQEPRTITSTKASSRRRLDRRALPAVLPDEFLASDDSDSDSDSGAGDDDQGRRRRKGAPETHNKITKFNTVARQVARAEARHQQQPADARVGATVYRVAKKPADRKLAPRGGKYSRNAREGLLRRGRAVPATTGTGKKGFLVKR